MLTIRNKKIFIGFLLIVIALLILVVGNFRRSMQYYLTVDELMAAPEMVRGRDFRLSGKVVQGSIKHPSEGKQVYEFLVSHGGQTIKVIYRGFAPDSFNDSSSVVVRGRFDEENMVFLADHLMAKCASKYEAKLNPRTPGVGS